MKHIQVYKVEFCTKDNAQGLLINERFHKKSFESVTRLCVVAHELIFKSDYCNPSTFNDMALDYLCGIYYDRDSNYDKNLNLDKIMFCEYNNFLKNEMKTDLLSHWLSIYPWKETISCIKP